MQRDNKRPKIVQAPKDDRAELWEAHVAHQGAQWTAIAGPCLPGTTFGPDNTRFKYATVTARTKIARCGPYWIPAKNHFAGLPRSVWKQMAQSPCAWRRIVETAKPLQVQKGTTVTTVPHMRLQSPPGTAPLVHRPPMHVTKTANTLVRCAYCGAGFPSTEAYATQCAPDAPQYMRKEPQGVETPPCSQK